MNCTNRAISAASISCWKLNDAWQALTEARQAGFNLLLNTAPLPNGSLDPEDVEVFQQMGERIRKEVAVALAWSLWRWRQSSAGNAV